MAKLYWADTDMVKNEECYQKGLLKVTKERRKKAEQCSMQADKERSLCAGLLLHFAWEEHRNEKKEPPLEMQVGYEVNGKPYCVTDPAFHFSLSHSGNKAVCLVSSQNNGVDIQEIKNVNVKIAERFFLQEEYHWLQSFEGAQKQEAFCKLWTLKESYIKLTGNGMKQGLQSFLVNPSENRVTDLKTNRTVYGAALEILPGYMLGICLDSFEEVEWIPVDKSLHEQSK